jgi:hypothetical protein
VRVGVWGKTLCGFVDRLYHDLDYQSAMEILEERYTFDTSDPRFVHIHLVLRIASGEDMGGPMWIERDNVPWVVEQIRACISTYAFERVCLQAGQDNLQVLESGHEQQPMIVVRNRRAADAPHAGPFTLAMSKHLVARFVDELAERYHQLS